MTIDTDRIFVAARIRRWLDHVPAERIVVAPDCGRQYLPRAVAFGKADSDGPKGAAMVRRELTGRLTVRSNALRSHCAKSAAAA